MRSTLHLALPALETLHSTWSGRAKNLKYSCFWGALEEAVAKVDEYYQKTSTSDAYTFAMGTCLVTSIRSHLTLSSSRSAEEINIS
jgi:hypothetical protein